MSQADARAAVDILRAHLQGPEVEGLGSHEHEVVEDDLDQMARDLDTPHADKEDVRERLTRVTSILKEAGALAGAGAALVGPLSAVAQWLGPLGTSVLHILPG